MQITMLERQKLYNDVLTLPLYLFLAQIAVSSPQHKHRPSIKRSI